MSSEESTVEVSRGDSDMVTFEIENHPPQFRISQIGDDPEIRYRYDWDERGSPTPEQFERVSYLEVKLVTMMTDLDGEVSEKADEAHEALVELKKAMADERDLEGDQRRNVMLGNLEELPEVNRRVE